MLLFAVAAYVLVEAWRRWNAPPEIASGLMLVVAVVGLLANARVAGRAARCPAREPAMRGAYLEVMGDLVGSGAVIVAAIVIVATGWLQADALASVLIAILILPRTWSLLKEAVDVLLEASPKGIDLAEVRSHILEAPGVADVHDLHAWTITSGVNVVSAHVVLEAAPTRRRCSTTCAAACQATSTSSTRRSSSRPPTAGVWRAPTTPEARPARARLRQPRRPA